MKQSFDKHSRCIELLMGNQDSIYRYILSMVPHIADADDILQETSKFIWQKFDDYEAGTSFKSWATTIARYKVLEYYRSKQRNKVNFSSQTIDIISNYLTEHNKEDNDADGKKLNILKKCISKLNDKDRKLIEQKYTQDITTKQLAMQFGRSVSGLYSTLARIHRLLVDCVHQHPAE